jgi:hypothetical protein
MAQLPGTGNAMGLLIDSFSFQGPAKLVAWLAYVHILALFA